MRPVLPLFALLISAQSALADVTVFAASSLKTALDEIAADWQTRTGRPVILTYGGSAAMAKQIAEGAPADIFISASVEWMDDLAGRALIQPNSRRDLLGNRLVLVAHGAAQPVVLDETLDLAGLLAGGRLSMAMVASVPAGQYGAEALQNLGLWDQVKDSLAQSENVRAALQLVALGEAPLGVVYTSDAVAEPGVSVIGTFPETSHRPIVYPAALMPDAGKDAAAFLDHLSTPEAMAVFSANGFIPLP
ncbi:MAG: molybdate ABC transporter substrate-binding protein [Rhodobacterales bacterium]|nr:molybdate ABC transporter substrate-binding protein [Rhodobacterales bacterium]